MSAEPEIDEPGPAESRRTALAHDWSSGASSSVDLAVLGWDHRRSPSSVLEQVCLPPCERPRLLALLRNQACSEAVVLSTCSRTEVYTRCAMAARDVLGLVAQHRDCPVDELAPSAYQWTGTAALEHLCRVTAGLESRIVGEPEVAGQVRRAVRDARRAGTVGTVLTPIFSAAVRCAQRVRDVSGLGTPERSWGARAVDVGLRAVGPVPAPQVLVVGSGRMARDIVEVLRDRGLPPRVAARDPSAARRLGGPQHGWPLTALPDALVEADLVCCTTSASHDVITADDVRTGLAGRQRPLVVLDLSVPRDVDPEVAQLPGVSLLGPQHLGDDFDTGVLLAAAVDAGSALVRVEVGRYSSAVAARRAGPFIAALRRHVQDLCLAELQRAAPASTTPEELTRAAHLVAARLLHQPIVTARAAAAAGDAAALRLLAGAFGVPDESLPQLPVQDLRPRWVCD